MKYCGEQGCKNLISTGFYCPDHRRRRKRKRSNYRHSNKSFYNSGVWKRTREYVYELRKGLCERCGRFVHGREAHVHHIIIIAVNYAFQLVLTNLRLLCPECHVIEENEMKENEVPSYFKM